jgi:hypothetical protein
MDALKASLGDAEEKAPKKRKPAKKTATTTAKKRKPAKKAASTPTKKRANAKK